MLRKCQNQQTLDMPIALSSSMECTSLLNDMDNLIDTSYTLEYNFTGITSLTSCVLRLVSLMLLFDMYRIYYHVGRK